MDVAWWVKVGDGVWVRRHRELDLSLGVVIGERWCLVVDTGGDEVQGAEFAAAVRELTPLPWTVVITHAHFDHAFGTAAFEGAAVWGHARCRIALRESAEAQRAEWAERYRSEGKPELAERLERARVVVPEAWPGGNLDLGGRLARLVAPGPGHTDHDLVVQVPDAGVVFAGDLVEQGAPPAFGDAYPAGWPLALDAVLGLAPVTVVPGHGEPVDADFVRTQREEIALVARLCADVRAGLIPVEAAVERSPYPEEFTREALSRV